MPRIWFIASFYKLLFILLFAVLFVSAPACLAEGPLSIFSGGFNTRKVIQIEDVSDHKTPKKELEEKKEESSKVNVSERKERAKLRYVTGNPEDDKILPPNETPSVRVNPDAPSSIRAMISAKRNGDQSTAEAYAQQFVRYQQDLFFEVRDMVSLIGNALIKEKVIDDDDWVGAGQMIDYELAKTRLEIGATLKPTHEAAMKRITGDSNQEVEIFYFFSLDCSWCRYMASDIERLWRIAKKDKRIKMAALTMGESTNEWLDEYKSYSEWSMPVLPGDELAKQWKIGFVPAVVIVTPSNGKAYMKTGQQSFERLYEFLRTAQGLPATVTSEFKALATTPIGKAERMKAGKVLITKSNYNHNGSGLKKRIRNVQIQRF